MIKPKTKFRFKKVSAIGLSTALLAGLISTHGIWPKETAATPSMLEFRWDNTGNYKKLYFTQSSSQKRDRSKYFLVMRKRDRRNATLKIKIDFPKNFDSKIKPNKLSLCEVSVGGMLDKTKCKKRIPAIFEVNVADSSIEVFPNQPIPARQAIAVVMKIFNPSRAGMYQINATSQTPGDLPISSYIGSWSVDVD